MDTAKRMQVAQNAAAAAETGAYGDGRRTLQVEPDVCRQCVYVTPLDVLDFKPTGGTDPEYVVLDMDAYSALRSGSTTGRTSVLNFACGTTPGGAFLSGGDGQEERLCRQSTLYASLASDGARSYYEDNERCLDNLTPLRMLYSPAVFVVRDANETRVLDEPIETQVISMAAPDLKGRAQGTTVAPLLKYYTGAIRMMCQFLARRAETLVLGPWGCGAYGNSPWMVAESFRKVLVDEGLDAEFSQIIFAVGGTGAETSRVFHEVFGNADNMQLAAQSADPDKPTEIEGTGFTKGKRAHMVFRISPKDAPQPEWDEVQVTIRSSGPKYVVVVRDGKTTQFLASDKPTLLSTKNRSYLVKTKEQAEKLLSMLRGSVVASKGRSA